MSENYLLLAARYRYNNPSRGASYEYEVIFKELSRSLKIDFCDPYSTMLDSKILENYTTIIYFPYLGAVSPRLLEKQAVTKTVYIFLMDDQWRSDLRGKYDRIGIKILSTDIYFDIRNVYEYANPEWVSFGVESEALQSTLSWEDKSIGCSFIGARDSYREYVIDHIRSIGIEIQCFGEGWPNGHVNRNQFWEILKSSRVSLNISNSANYDLKYLLKKPLGFFRGMRSGKSVEQIKARHIEICAAKAVQITTFVPGLEKIFDLNKEIVCLDSFFTNDQILKGLFRKESLLKNVAEAGYKRVSDRTYSKIINLARHR